ncbi:MAG: signal peptidase II [Propionibacteriaceae bacterium]|jgi:signal peptidase II|nr:signal peptidase II [Propionibacteriaceae bacterium]
MIIISVLIVVGVVIDQATKALALAKLTPGEPISIISDIFQLSLLRNPGAAFGTGASLTVGFAILAIVVLTLLTFFVVPKVRSMVWAIPIGLGMAGMTGNFVDRLIRPPGIFQGHVIDFFAVKYFAVFNVADIFLTVAAILVVALTLFYKTDFTGTKTDRADKDATVDEG